MSTVKGFGIIVGLMFGAGIFALPFAIYNAGIFWGLIHLLAACFIIIFLLFLYAEVTYYTEGTHRLPGYVEILLGDRAKRIIFLIIILSYYGTLLAYGVLGGKFLSNFLSGNFSFVLSMIFFAAGSVLILLKLEKVALVNFYLTIPLFAFVAFLLFIALPSVDFANFSLGSDDFSFKPFWFLPYGIWLFALSAFAAIPETHDILKGSSLKKFKKVILVSVLMSALFYLLFVFSVVGVSGENTSKDALSGLSGVLGSKIILAGSMMGFLAVFTSFLALGIDLRGTFRFDLGFHKVFAWFFVIAPPVSLYALGFHNFTRILSFVGTFGTGAMGVFIILMARQLRQREEALKALKSRALVEWVIAFAVLAAVVYEIINIFK